MRKDEAGWFGRWGVALRLGLAMLAVAATGAMQPAAAQRKLVIFSQPIPHYDSVWMADAKGLYAAEGLDVTFRQFASGTTALQSFRAGEGDILFGGDFPGVQYWLNNHHDYRLIAAIERDGKSYLVTSLKTIAKPQDLKGKTVATRVGSTVDWFMSEFLTKNGMSVKDVTVKNLDGQVMPAALCQGDIDAFFYWQPYNDKAIEMCGGKVHNLSNAEGYIPGYVIAAARPEWLAKPENAKAAIAFLRATIKGKALAAQDFAAVAAYAKDKFSMPEDVVRTQWRNNVRMVALNGTVYKDYCELADWMRQQNLLQGKLDLSQFVWTEGLSAVDPEIGHAAAAAVLILREVRKHYGDDEAGYLALDGIDAEIGSGEFFSLLGPSGCGKTTLLNILAGFERATDGSIMLNGQPIAGPDRKRVMFFQDANEALFPWLTVRENVEFGLRVAGVRRSERRAPVDRFLEMVGLAAHADKLPAQLSGGMRQRVQIARALVINPEIVLMDEPFAALDALTRRKMHVELLRIWQETRKTVIFVTHDIAEAITLSDRIAIMSVGPGSRMRDIVAVAMARPRDPAEPRFGQLYGTIERLLAEEPEAPLAEA